MNKEEIKKAIIDSLAEQDAFKDLPPSMLVKMTIDMVFEILRKYKI